MTRNIIEVIDGLKRDLDELRPLPPDVVGRIAQKIRLESNYHSNAIEGNTLTLSETRNLILHGLTAQGKPMRDHLDMEGHDDAVKAIENAVRRKEALNGVFIRNLHRVLLNEPYEMDALTPDGRLTKRLISVGQYKTVPNNVKTTTGEVHYYTAPEQVQSEMSDLIDWYREQEASGEHPIIVAATFHYQFVRIHPFDDGNGRMARLLMNMILIGHGYTLAIVEKGARDRYIREIEDVARTGSLSQFIKFIASCCEYTLRLHLSAARGESIEDAGDIDREIEIFKRSVQGRGRSSGTVPGREYVETVVGPFREYCIEKLERLAGDVFVRADEWYCNIEGKGADGNVFSVSADDPSEISSIPPEVAEMSIRWVLALSGFQATDTMYEIRIGNQYDLEGNRWVFTTGGDFEKGQKRECEGSDTDDLRAHFNGLLRWIMAELRRTTMSKPESGEKGADGDLGVDRPEGLGGGSDVVGGQPETRRQEASPDRQSLS